MNKKRVAAVLKRSRGYCEVCGSAGVELHHILGGSGKRRQQERTETVIALCYHCHRGNYGVHGKNGLELNLRLKRGLQDYYFKQGMDEDKVRELMGGKLY